MTARLTVPLGVIVVREAMSHSWEEFRWRTVGVSLDVLDKADWRRKSRRKGFPEYHAAMVPLTLQSKESISYRVNLANGEPSLYVVLRHDPQASAEHPITVRCVTASPFEAQAFSDLALDWVDRVPMPARLVGIVEGFVAHDCMDDELPVATGPCAMGDAVGGYFEPDQLRTAPDHDDTHFLPRR